MRPAVFIGVFTAAVFNPWLIDHFIPAQKFAQTQFWAIAALDIFLILWSLISLKKISSSTIQNLLFSFSVLVWSVFTISIADHRIGPRILEHKKNLVYGAFDRARMVSTEFDITYRMNNLGFRGPHTEIEKDDRERVAFIGDSFTFGWGVEEENTWIGILRKTHPEIEFLNLGRGGEDPMGHVQQARKIIPLLKPDRLVVCLLAWNDLFQMKRALDHERGSSTKTYEVDRPEPTTPLLHLALRHFFPNIISVFANSSNTAARWKAESTWIRSQLDEEGLRRYNALNNQVRSAFESNILNPWIVYEGVFHGQSYLQACQGEMNEALIRISHHLKELEVLATEHRCRLDFIVLPYRPSNCIECLSDLAGLGYEVDSEIECLTGSMIERPLDSMISTSIKYFNPWQFQSATVHGWYFPLDGHLNEQGNMVVAAWADTVLFR